MALSDYRCGDCGANPAHYGEEWMTPEFCPECGSANMVYQEPYEEGVDPDEIFDDGLESEI